MGNVDFARENASKISKRIDSLPKLNDFLSEPDFKLFWEQVRQVNEMFRTLRPLLKEDCDRLRASLNQRCEVAKSEQQRFFRARKQESSRKRELVLDTLREARAVVRSAETNAEIAQAQALLQQAVGRMKDGWDGFNAQTAATAFTLGRMLKEDRDACWSQLNEIRDDLRRKRESLQHFNDERFQRYVSEAEALLHAGEYRAAKDKVQEAQRAMKGVGFTSSGYSALKNSLNSVWRRSSEGQSQRSREWEERQRTNLSRWADARRRNEERIERIEAQIEKCRGMLASANSREFASKVEGWIAEYYARLVEVQGWNADLDSKIASVRDKLRL